MIKSYFKTAVRSFFRNKAFSIINIGGLAIGIASAILILLWVQNEVSYDQFHVNADRLYEVYSNDSVDNSMRALLNTPKIMASFLKNDIPEIDQVSRVSWDKEILLTVGDKGLMAKANSVDTSFLTMFSFPLLKGSAKTVFDDPNSIVLTEKLAMKLFGNEDAMGKFVRMENVENFKVTGILKNLPNNTLFNFEFLDSYTYRNSIDYGDSDWTNLSIRTFVLLKRNAAFDAVNMKIKNIITEHSGGSAKTTELLYPINKLRLYSNFENDKRTGSRIEIVRVFSITAIMILLIACINFMNLSTARGGRRAKEVGNRKVAGAQKISLIGQFLAESMFISLIAGVFALLIVQLCLPAFNEVVRKQLFIDYGNLNFWCAGIGFILMTGVLAGTYPAFFLSAFSPVSVLKGTFKKVNALITSRKVLVILQFTTAISLIVCTIVVEHQLKYAQSREIGYDKQSLGYVDIRGDAVKNYELIRNMLLSSGVAVTVSKTQAPLTQNWVNGINVNWQGKDPDLKVQVNQFIENGDLVKTAGMKLVQGRDIDPKYFPSDSNACLINESLAKLMGSENPVGWLITDGSDKWHVVGVIGDFILESPYEPIRPFMMVGPKYGGSIVHIKLNNANSTKQNLEKASNIFKQYNPAYPFDFHFIDEEYAQKFSDEKLTGTLISLFAALAIFISCLGLFGLATYMAETRTKEIGVRKILGASVSHIVALLSADFLKLIVVAFLIAASVSWMFMNNWLQDFNYRIQIEWWVFAVAGIAALLVAAIAISFQAIKAAVANPVKSLRTE